jgi:hypothetical protein
MARTRAKTRPAMEDPRALWAEARGTLGLSGTDLARLLDVSRKTISRQTAGRSPIDGSSLGALAPHVHARDPALAERMHAYAVADSAHHAVPAPPPLPVSAPPAAPPVPPAPREAVATARLRVQAVLCVASHAMDASPRAVRRALLAAFRHARELGLTFEDVERELRPAAKAKKEAPVDS